MWDQLIVAILIHQICRIIPTYVGSTVAVLVLALGHPNHSHVCGINENKVLFQTYEDESFPRMWDQHHILCPVQKWFRIIPTYVGSTPSPLKSSNENSNHSHVCGINQEVLQKAADLFESFPRMWDQPCRLCADTLCFRIIPTYVGSTKFIIKIKHCSTNHSHVCGINSISFSIYAAASESFPRMWDQRIQSFR